MPEIILKGDFAAKKLFFAHKLRAAEGGRTAAAGGSSSAEVALFRHEKKQADSFAHKPKGVKQKRNASSATFICDHYTAVNF